MKKERLLESLIIVADLGELKAYRVKEEMAIDPKDDAQTSHKHHKGTLIDALRPELVLAVDFIDAHKKITEEVTDKVGRNKAPYGAGESGEPHNLKLEIEHRLLKEIADEIMRLVRNENPKRWHLAFPAEHHKALMDRIDPDVREKLDVKIPEDLTKVKPETLLERFGA
ncbi:host attachment protein [Nitratifractor sp.]